MPNSEYITIIIADFVPEIKTMKVTHWKFKKKTVLLLVK
jgi:hypothetical protein